MDDVDGIQVMLFLVRHGETLANKAGILQGQSESPLSEKGERQAGEVGEALKNVPFWRGYSSDLGRAKNTARILLGRHHNGAALAEHALVLDPNLRECALGWKEMLPRGTGEAEGRRIAQEQGTEGRPMEDWPDVERRGGLFLERLGSDVAAAAAAEQAGTGGGGGGGGDSSADGGAGGDVRHVLVTSHGGFLSMFLQSALGLFVHELRNCSVSR
jgi:probable phosphoglycerate mutase